MNPNDQTGSSAGTTSGVDTAANGDWDNSQGSVSPMISWWMGGIVSLLSSMGRCAQKPVEQESQTARDTVALLTHEIT